MNIDLFDDFRSCLECISLGDLCAQSKHILGERSGNKECIFEADNTIQYPQYPHQ